MKEFMDALINMSISGAVIAAVIMLLRIPLKKAPRRYSYMLWAILGIRLLCPFSLPSPASLFNLFSANSDGGRVTFTAPANVYTVTGQQTTANVVNNTPAAVQPMSDGVELYDILFWVWIAGVAAFILWNAISCIRLRGKISGAVHLRENIWECGNIDTAFVMGVFRPRIYVPAGLPGRSCDLIITHEKTHIRRLDFIVKPIALLALCLHWFNPLAWAGFFLMVRDMEISCDELAVKGLDVESRKEYANALLNMSAKQNRISVNGVLAFGESSIKQRIKSVLNPKKPALWITIAAVILIAAAAVCLLTNPGKKPESTPEVTPTTSGAQQTIEASSVSPEPEATSAPETTTAPPTQPDPVEVPELDKTNAEATVNALLGSASLNENTDGSLDFSFTVPGVIPTADDGKTQLYLTLNAYYYVGGGTFESKRYLDWDASLKPGEVWNATVLSAGDDREFQSVMLRAAFMTEVEEKTYSEYYGDYIEVDRDTDTASVTPPEVIIGAPDLKYRFSGDSWTVTFSQLPDGITLSNSKPDEHNPGIPAVEVLKDGRHVGYFNMMQFGTTHADSLAQVDTSADTMPMQIYSPIGLSSMVDYSAGYRVVSSTETGAAAIAFPEFRDGGSSQCAMAYDIAQVPYFAMFGLDAGTLTEKELADLAAGITITAD